MDPVRRARRGLLIFFAVVIPLSGFIELLSIHRVPWIPPVARAALLMWMPALGALVARLALGEELELAALRLGGGRGLRTLLVAVAFPITVLSIAYGIAWATGLAVFQPPDETILLPSWSVSLHGPPAWRLAQQVGIHLTLGLLPNAFAAAGEELGWRNYLLQRLIAARVPWPVPLSGFIWAAWHWPLIYAFQPAGLGGPVAVLLFTALVVPLACLMAAQRLESGSLWPAIALHAVWNDLLGAYQQSTPNEGIWLGETGPLVVLPVILLTLPWVMRMWRRELATAPLAPVSAPPA